MITNHVPTYETCLRMKGFGYPCKTIFYWSNIGDGPGLFHDKDFSTQRDELDFNCAAPLLSEILEELRKISPDIVVHLLACASGYAMRALGRGIDFNQGETSSETAALLWIYLKENEKNG